MIGFVPRVMLSLYGCDELLVSSVLILTAKVTRAAMGRAGPAFVPINPQLQLGGGWNDANSLKPFRP